MFKLKLHWWILIGIVVGALAGTAVHRSYYPTISKQARVEVLGATAWNEADEAAHMKEIQKREKALLQQTAWGAPIYWIRLIHAEPPIHLIHRALLLPAHLTATLFQQRQG